MTPRIGPTSDQDPTTEQNALPLFLSSGRSKLASTHPKTEVSYRCGCRRQIDIPSRSVIPRDLRVWAHPSTSPVIARRSSSKTHGNTSFWKWISPGRDKNQRVASSIPSCRKNLRDPVSMRGANDRAAASSQAEPLPSFINVSWEAIIFKSPRSGNERVRFKICGSGPTVKIMQWDLKPGGNPWNRMKVDSAPGPRVRCTMWEKFLNQPPASVTISGQPTNRFLVERAGELGGSGNVAFQDWNFYEV